MFDYNLFDNDNAKSKNGSALTAEKTEKKKPKNSAARIRASNKYSQKTYEHFNIYVKKDEAYKIELICKNFGDVSKSAAVNKLIEAEFERLTKADTEAE